MGSKVQTILGTEWLIMLIQYFGSCKLIMIVGHVDFLGLERHTVHATYNRFVSPKWNEKHDCFQN